MICDAAKGVVACLWQNVCSFSAREPPHQEMISIQIAF